MAEQSTTVDTRGMLHKLAALGSESIVNFKAGTDDILHAGSTVLGNIAESQATTAVGEAATKVAGDAVAKGAGEAVTAAAGDAAVKAAGDAVAKGAGEAIVTAGGEAATKAAGDAVAKGAGEAIAKGAGEAATKAAGDAAVSATAAGVASTALGGLAFADLGAQAVSGLTDLVDPMHEARSTDNGKNVVSGALGTVAGAADKLGDDYDAGLKAGKEAASKIPVIGGLAGLYFDARRMAASTVQNVVTSTTRDFEEASNAIGNETNGARSTHSSRMDEEDILDTDDIPDAMRKGGVVGVFKKFIGDTKTKEESLDDAADEGADLLNDMHTSGTLTDEEVQNAGELLAKDKSAFVEAVESVRSGDKTAEEAFGGKGDGKQDGGRGSEGEGSQRQLADAPEEGNDASQAQRQAGD